VRVCDGATEVALIIRARASPDRVEVMLTLLVCFSDG
jgi:hypothetical protein